MAYLTDPKVGEGVTICRFSDRQACTIVAVSSSGHRIELQRDAAVLLNAPNSGAPDALEVSVGGFCAHVSGAQRYSYARDETAPRYVATRRKDGSYRLRGSSTEVLLAGRHEHYDFNF